MKDLPWMHRIQGRFDSEHYLRSVTARQFETGNAGLPRPSVCGCPGNSVVFVEVPERAVIHGVNIHRGVIAPAGVGSRLHPGAIDHRGFAEIELPERVTGQTPAVTDARIHIYAIDHTIANGHISLLVLGDTAHPAMHTIVRSVGALLVERVSAIDAADLVPANPSHTRSSLHRLIGHQCLVIPEATIGEPPGGSLAIREDIQVLGFIFDPWLWKAIA